MADNGRLPVMVDNGRPLPKVVAIEVGAAVMSIAVEIRPPGLAHPVAVEARLPVLPMVDNGSVVLPVLIAVAIDDGHITTVPKILGSVVTVHRAAADLGLLVVSALDCAASILLTMLGLGVRLPPVALSVLLLGRSRARPDEESRTGNKCKHKSLHRNFSPDGKPVPVVRRHQGRLGLGNASGKITLASRLLPKNPNRLLHWTHASD
ncbi:MAG TPA: hypothetical protein V6D08_00705 [Candidatus Obscuribacterales bacterium]